MNSVLYDFQIAGLMFCTPSHALVSPVFILVKKSAFRTLEHYQQLTLKKSTFEQVAARVLPDAPSLPRQAWNLSSSPAVVFSARLPVLQPQKLIPLLQLHP